MPRRTLFTIILGVIVFHAGVFWLLAGKSPLPKITPISRPNFFAREAEYTDQETGKTYIYREFQVSTKLAFPDVLMEEEK